MITLSNITKTYHMGTVDVHALCGVSLLPLMAWSTYKMAMESYRVGEMAMDIALPMYPGKFVISIGLCLWTIQMGFQIVDHLRGVEKPKKGGAK